MSDDFLAPSRAKESGGDKKPQSVLCGNGYYGCGGSFPIRRYDTHTQTFEAENYAPHVRLCLPCANRVAHRWGVAFESLDYLMTALSCMVGSTPRVLDIDEKLKIKGLVERMEKAAQDPEVRQKTVEYVTKRLEVMP